VIPHRNDLESDEERLEAELRHVHAQLELIDRVEELEEDLANALAEIETLKTAAKVAGERVRELEAEVDRLRPLAGVAYPLDVRKK